MSRGRLRWVTARVHSRFDAVMPLHDISAMDSQILERARRFCVLANASGSGKTTLARQIASRTRAPYLELDSVFHGPNWTPDPGALRARVSEFIEQGSWVLDGAFLPILGPLAVERADLVVWLDLPMRVWLPRLVSRTARRWWTQEELWNGNRELLREVLFAPDALLPHAVRTHAHKRCELVRTLTDYPTLRLRSRVDVEEFKRRLG